jgi:hypothetical protein
MASQNEWLVEPPEWRLLPSGFFLCAKCLFMNPGLPDVLQSVISSVSVSRRLRSHRRRNHSRHSRSTSSMMHVSNHGSKGHARTSSSSSEPSTRQSLQTVTRSNPSSSSSPSAPAKNALSSEKPRLSPPHLWSHRRSQSEKCPSPDRVVPKSTFRSKSYPHRRKANSEG